MRGKDTNFECPCPQRCMGSQPHAFMCVSSVVAFSLGGTFQHTAFGPRSLEGASVCPFADRCAFPAYFTAGASSRGDVCLLLAADLHLQPVLRTPCSQVLLLHPRSSSLDVNFVPVKMLSVSGQGIH